MTGPDAASARPAATLRLIYSGAMDRLPPFDTLLAFEAALRLGSMTLAARELGLTQSAISHRLRRLEGFMGLPLLQRQGSGLQPTPAGAALRAGLDALLDDLAALRSRCQQAAAPHRLRVGISAAIADHWLVHRLPAFAAAYPHLSVELVVLENQQGEPPAGLDVRVLWLPHSELRASALQRPLCAEQVFPVCHPSLLPPGFVPGDARVLAKLPLLHKGRAGVDAAAEWSWPAWFERLGLPGPPREQLRFETIGPAVSAALSGAGVVLARSMLVHDALAQGRLVRLLGPDQDQPSSKAHLVRWRADQRGDAKVQAIAGWLVAQAEATLRIGQRRDAAWPGVAPAPARGPADTVPARGQFAGVAPLSRWPAASADAAPAAARCGPRRCGQGGAG